MPLLEDDFGTGTLTESSGSVLNDRLLFHNPVFSFNCFSASLFSDLPTFSVSPHFFLSLSFHPGVLAQCFLLKPLTAMVFGAELTQPCLVALGIPPAPTPLSRPARPPAWRNEIREDMMAQSSSPHPQADRISRA